MQFPLSQTNWLIIFGHFKNISVCGRKKQPYKADNVNSIYALN